ncbi:MAG: hypothetical protein ACE5JS_07090 [Nitrospinota bacterium]
MPTQDIRFERRYELWKDQNKQVARWALGTAFFATILLVMVLTPYTKYSKESETKKGLLARDRAELSDILARSESLAKVTRRVDTIRATIEREPWMAEKKLLVDTLSALFQARQRLLGQSRQQIQDAILREEQSSAGTQMTQQQAGPARTDPSVEAVNLLKLSVDQLTGVHSDQELWRLVEEQLKRRVQGEADNKVRRIVKRVEQEVIKPLEGVLRDTPGAGGALAGLPPMLDRLRADMDRWAKEHIGNPRWYETIQMKDRKLRELTRSLQQWQGRFVGLVEAQQQKLDLEKDELTRELQQKEKKVEEIQNDISGLDVKMQNLLPDFFRNLVSPKEMLQLYPFVLLGLFCFIAIKAEFLRRHYLVVRESFGKKDISPKDSAMSSIWTLVYRGNLGTARTLALYLSGIALLWWLFETGSGLVAAWLRDTLETTWVWVSSWLSITRWVGRVVFAAAIVFIVVVFLKEREVLSRGTIRSRE